METQNGEQGAQGTHRGNGEMRRPHGRAVCPLGAHGHGQRWGVGFWATLDGLWGGTGVLRGGTGERAPLEQAVRASWGGSWGV